MPTSPGTTRPSTVAGGGRPDLQWSWRTPPIPGPVGAKSFGMSEGPGRGHLAHDVGQLFERVLGREELAGNAATVDHHDAIGDRVHVKDVLVDEDRRLPRGSDAPDEVQELVRLLQRKPHRRLVE